MPISNIANKKHTAANPDKKSHFVGLDLSNEVIAEYGVAFCGSANVRPSELARAMFAFAIAKYNEENPS